MGTRFWGWVVTLAAIASAALLMHAIAQPVCYGTWVNITLPAEPEHVETRSYFVQDADGRSHLIEIPRTIAARPAHSHRVCEK
jgi:putative Ca2+/H+ antiporter (TMEM165/GDT1 family)